MPVPLLVGDRKLISRIGFADWLRLARVGKEKIPEEISVALRKELPGIKKQGHLPALSSLHYICAAYVAG